MTRSAPLLLEGPEGFATLLARVLGSPSALARVSGPRIVAIDGRSGVGKSTLAARLGEATGAAVLDGDGFFAGGIEVHRGAPVDRVACCIDWRRQREVLTDLRAGRTATYRAFDWDAFDGSLELRPTVVAPAPIVILEGVYAARPELEDLLDLRVLLRVPDAVRKRRLEEREGGVGPWELAWHEAEVWYFAHAAPEARFDVVIQGGE